MTPEIAALSERYRRAIENLSKIQKDHAEGTIDHVRIGGKIEGVRLASSYFDEATRLPGKPIPEDRSTDTH